MEPEKILTLSAFRKGDPCLLPVNHPFLIVDIICLNMLSIHSWSHINTSAWTKTHVNKQTLLKKKQASSLRDTNTHIETYTHVRTNAHAHTTKFLYTINHPYIHKYPRIRTQTHPHKISRIINIYLIYEYSFLSFAKSDQPEVQCAIIAESSFCDLQI